MQHVPKNLDDNIFKSEYNTWKQQKMKKSNNINKLILKNKKGKKKFTHRYQFYKNSKVKII